MRMSKPRVLATLAAVVWLLPVVLVVAQRPQREMHYCVMMRNEGAYVREWVEYHVAVGVTQLVLLNHYSEQNETRVLQAYVDRGLVKIYDVVSLGGELQQQGGLYNICLELQRNKTYWLGFGDVDLFWVPTTKEDLHEVLDDYTDYGGLSVSSINFASSGFENKPEGLVIENFRHHIALDFVFNSSPGRVNTIANVQHVQSAGVHNNAHVEGKFAVNERKEPLEDLQAFIPVNYVDIVQANHYYTKSYEEYVLKNERNRMWSSKMDQWETRNRNDVYDTKILRFVNATKRRLELEAVLDGQPIDALSHYVIPTQVHIVSPHHRCYECAAAVVNEVVAASPTITSAIVFDCDDSFIAVLSPSLPAHCLQASPRARAFDTARAGVTYGPYTVGLGGRVQLGDVSSAVVVLTQMPANTEGIPRVLASLSFALARAAAVVVTVSALDTRWDAARLRQLLLYYDVQPLALCQCVVDGSLVAIASRFSPPSLLALLLSLRPVPLTSLQPFQHEGQTKFLPVDVFSSATSIDQNEGDLAGAIKVVRQVVQHTAAAGVIVVGCFPGLLALGTLVTACFDTAENIHEYQASQRARSVEVTHLAVAVEDGRLDVSNIRAAGQVVFVARYLEYQKSPRHLLQQLWRLPSAAAFVIAAPLSLVRHRPTPPANTHWTVAEMDRMLAAYDVSIHTLGVTAGAHRDAPWRTVVAVVPAAHLLQGLFLCPRVYREVRTRFSPLLRHYAEEAVAIPKLATGIYNPGPITAAVMDDRSDLSHTTYRFCLENVQPSESDI